MYNIGVKKRRRKILKKLELEKELKSRFYQKIVEFFEEEGEEVLQINGFTFCVPTVDAEKNEAWVRVKVDVPRGQRGEGGEIFNGYDEANNYKFESEEKAKRKAEIKKQKELKIERDQRRREELKKQREKE